MGVSPWYWWADVPVRRREVLCVRPGRYVQAEPAVRYRGIFLNDEAPSLTGWVNEKFGGYNHRFYEHVFELLLRLKANYLWPAMWNSAFNEDDPLNPRLADEYGIVMGTSHHEPMLRAQQEWKRHGSGPWEYATNGEVLRRFWDEGIERNKSYESIITLGMRGDGDKPMSPTADFALLERIVHDQREILARRMNPDPAAVPQDWALYKEVQEYYEKGMRVPDDVTLLWSDDNWGNLRRLPAPDERSRAGGAGIYYHFDYVGGPRSYKWLNTIPITKVQEQMNLAYHHGANRIWIVNVGDLKPMEFPMEFFLTKAWNPERWPSTKVVEFGRLWAEREFGPPHAAEIAAIVARYTQYNSRRKPELLEPDTFSLVDYQEADRVWREWETITQKAEMIYQRVPPKARDAFFQLVLYPTKASAQVVQLYIAAGKNRLYASQGRASANDWADETRALFRKDQELSRYYNQTLTGGKWDHMMDQTHIGYTYWNQPPENKMPEVTELRLPEAGALGVALEGSAAAWPGPPSEPALPVFDAFNRQRRYIDVFNRGRGKLEYRARADCPWVQLSASQGSIEKDQRLWVRLDWARFPQGSTTAHVTIRGPDDSKVVIRVNAFNPAQPRRNSLNGFVEAEGYVSIEAEHYSRRVNGAAARWERLDNFGRTLSAMTLVPVTAASAMPAENSARLEYRVYLFTPGELEVETILAPTLNFVPGRGLRYAISWDDDAPQVVDALEHNSQRDWEETVKDGVRKVRTRTSAVSAGYHTLKVWMVDPGVVLEKVVINTGGVKPSYLGPPESCRSQPGDGRQ